MDKVKSAITSKACDACRRRKLKCWRIPGEERSAEKCSQCLRSDSPCTFDIEQKKRGPKNGRRRPRLDGSSNGSKQNLQFRRSIETTEPELFQFESFRTDDEEFNVEADFPLIDPIPPFQSISSPSTVPSGIGTAQSLCTPRLDLATITTSQSWSHLQHSFHFSKEGFLDEVSQFFAQSWVAFPVLHWETVMEKLQNEVYVSDPDFCILLVSVGMLNEACKLRAFPSRGSANLNSLIRIVENLRRNSDEYDFSESPSMDTVIVSMFLFTAYSVCDRHNKAFCYLTEAIGLLDMIAEPLTEIEFIRLQRLEYVLFVTESASISIYGSGRKRRLASRPTLIVPHQTLMWYKDGSEIMVPERLQADEEAVKLLLLMTRLHLASEVTEVANVSVDDLMMANIAKSFENPTQDQSLTFSTQTADVAITRQWKLASQWWSVLSTGKTLPSSTSTLQLTIQILGMSTLQWSKTLEHGQLRIVGLGKVVALADSMLNIATKLGNVESCTNILGDLINTVLAMDYERYFAPQLSIIEICMAPVPRPILSDNDFEHYLLEM